MNDSTNNSLKRIICSMKKQANYEKYETLQLVASCLDLVVDFEKLQFTDGDYCLFPLPLDKIYSTIVANENLYILCSNGNIHILNLFTKKHLMRTIEEEPSFGTMFRWMCFSVWSRLFRCRKKW